MPGGQFTNLREQARSLGIDDVRWPEVARAYAQVNEMFGDIVKVTPTSKVVGDMALHDGDQRTRRPSRCSIRRRRSRFRNRWSRCSAAISVSRTAAFPPALQKKVLKGAQPLTVRPGRSAAADRPRARRAPKLQAQDLARDHGRGVRVLSDVSEGVPRLHAATALDYGRVSVLPTPVFFYGMEPGDEVTRRHRARQDADRALRRGERRATTTARAPCSSSSTASRARSRCRTAARSR